MTMLKIVLLTPIKAVVSLLAIVAEVASNALADWREAL